MESGQYSSGYFAVGKGGYYVVEKSPSKHKTEEVEAAKYLADVGYKVTLLNEANGGLHIKMPDGKIFTATYEQRTPESSPVISSLRHAAEKGAQVALIYDKNQIYHRRDIDAGIEEFEKYRSYRFEKIIVVENNGKIHIHKHIRFDMRSSPADYRRAAECNWHHSRCFGQVQK